MASASSSSHAQASAVLGANFRATVTHKSAGGHGIGLFKLPLGANFRATVARESAGADVFSDFKFPLEFAAGAAPGIWSKSRRPTELKSPHESTFHPGAGGDVFFKLPASGVCRSWSLNQLFSIRSRWWRAELLTVDLPCFENMRKSRYNLISSIIYESTGDSGDELLAMALAEVFKAS